MQDYWQSKWETQSKIFYLDYNDREYDLYTSRWKDAWLRLQVDPPSSAVLALSTTASRGEPTGVIKSQPGTTWHFILFTGLPFVCSSSPQPQRCCLCLSTQSPYQLPSVCSCNSHSFQCSTHGLFNKTSAPHFHSKEPDLPSNLLTVLHQLLVL